MDWSYENFKEAVFKLTGINLSCYKERQMKRRIDALITRNHFSEYKEYFDQLVLDRPLLDQFINYLTINVSEFYRNPGQWQVLDEEILPRLLKEQRQLMIWSAACSTGEEPYSLAMLLSRHLPLQKIKILATDIDQEALMRAKQGIYQAKSLENLPKDFVERFFAFHGSAYHIKECIKDCVSFKKHDLLRDPYPQNCHLILCRNVMIYFTEEAKTTLYKAFHQAMHPNGVLFVGSTEQIILPQRYHLKPMKIFFYQRESTT